METSSLEIIAFIGVIIFGIIYGFIIILIGWCFENLRIGGVSDPPFRVVKRLFLLTVSIAIFVVSIIMLLKHIL